MQEVGCVRVGGFAFRVTQIHEEKALKGTVHKIALTYWSAVLLLIEQEFLCTVSLQIKIVIGIQWRYTRLQYDVVHTELTEEETPQ